jgi:UDP-N-acetylglucosamine 2-epimerase
MAPPSRTEKRTRSSRLSEGKIPLIAVVGTRPEALKLAPVVRALRDGKGALSTRVCFSGQHGEMVRKIAAEIGLVPDFDLEGGKASESLSASLGGTLDRLDCVFQQAAPKGVLVQGDTTTALAGALAGFHRSIPVFHVEAGLRTSTPGVPFPEEMNRRLISRLATLHFAPTDHARDNLLREGVDPRTIVVTGNPIVDALAAFGRTGGAAADALLGAPDPERQRVVVTLHRRENVAHATSIAHEIWSLSRRANTEIVWIRHPNGTSRAALQALQALQTKEQSGTIRLLDPLPYATFIAILEQAHLVLTDSGGVQEEAPQLGVPVVVLRDETDRPEAVLSGNAVVAGSDGARIRGACVELLRETAARTRARTASSPFGDGSASVRIAAAIERWYEIHP